MIREVELFKKIRKKKNRSIQQLFGNLFDIILSINLISTNIILFTSTLKPVYILVQTASNRDEILI